MVRNLRVHNSNDEEEWRCVPHFPSSFYLFTPPLSFYSFTLLRHFRQAQPSRLLRRRQCRLPPPPSSPPSPSPSTGRLPRSPPPKSTPTSTPSSSASTAASPPPSPAAPPPAPASPSYPRRLRRLRLACRLRRRPGPPLRGRRRWCGWRRWTRSRSGTFGAW